MKLDVQLNVGTICLRGNLLSSDALHRGWQSLPPFLLPSLKHFIMTRLSHSGHHVDEEFDPVGKDGETNQDTNAAVQVPDCCVVFEHFCT